MSNDLQHRDATPVAPAGGAMVQVNTGRVVQEVQAAMTVAKHFPRDVTGAAERIRKSCERRGLAAKAVYNYPRGDKRVTGPSIRLAEVMAQNWGNLDFGIIEIEQQEGESTVMAYCWDLETNVRQTKIFQVKHERHKKGGVVTHLRDPRDIYETVANQGARRMRACILGIIPGDIQEMALEQCSKTMAGSEKDVPIAQRIQKMVAAFAEFQVTPEMIERKVGYKLAVCNEYDLEDLRGIYTSLKDNMSGREDWFDLETTDAVESHREQARAAREGQQSEPAADPPEAAPDPPADEPSDEDKARAKAKVAEALGEEPPAIPDEVLLSDYRMVLDAAKTLKRVDELEKKAKGSCDPVTAEAVSEYCSKRREELRGKRKPEPEEERF